ncbi:class I SAM-dependent methyltransferase [Nocardioides sp. ChNu-153]|uniref:class I SAM-dependent methyltransferase n=1 Tax=unclassified Nocardioides TaxID=2615069 RepID=UPI0024050E3B|nr:MULTISPECIES: class I SAM-dependent methyltransferase [unclassified Nocardioides]MDF9715144.1 class I SAM-dependent methyltransferase [Nocardioides sp. ChNu-99]MDN7121078.1 class I SAM-dependent methyltransferase [Nocardioides sp. ChNu-153]
MTTDAHREVTPSTPPAVVPPAPARPDVHRWPDLGRVPAGPRATAYARIARVLFHGVVSRLDVTVRIGSGPDAPAWGRGGPVMVVHRPDEFFARLGRHGLIGFGEAYQTGAWDVPGVDEGASPGALGDFLTVLAAQMGSLVPERLQRLRAAYVTRPPRHQVSSTENSRANIAHHYDLSNELFTRFLDPTTSYSSALFEHQLIPRTDAVGPHHVATSPDPRSNEALADAQGTKIDRLLDAAGVGAGTHVLEIGTGWGELALRAARRGARVHSVTLSTEQQALARRRIADADLTDRVDVELCDYRDVVAPPAGFDAVVSVEMVEAVGHEFWSTYFSKIDSVLAPGGRAGIQAITMPHDRMLATRETYTWIHKYIFPGGMLPSVQVVDEITRSETDLRLLGGEHRLSFGGHYAETLRRWDEAFLAAWPEITALGFDDTFARMWHFYLEYSRAGFSSGYIDVQQLVLQKDPT